MIFYGWPKISILLYIVSYILYWYDNTDILPSSSSIIKSYSEFCGDPFYYTKYLIQKISNWEKLIHLQFGHHYFDIFCDELELSTRHQLPVAIYHFIKTKKNVKKNIQVEGWIKFSARYFQVSIHIKSDHDKP